MFDLTLSFDNGPEPDVTPGVLDDLVAWDIRATFFVLGAKLATPQGRALAERARADGHWIGNHTWSHGAPLGLRPGAQVAEQEIGRTQAEIGALSHPDRLFRPHGGGAVGPQLLSLAAVDHLRAGGFTCVLWNAVPRDWAEPDAWVETALAQCASQPWTAMVLHDLPSGAMAHLPRFLDAVHTAGGRLRQDFPPTCTPIVRGEVLWPLDKIVTP
ncbi:MAG TPA: polysaccharide deacetylase family protein [Caulobacteraceae bacterium]|jgi:peptidoglycan/xylan/chitin deacetylase (PgdA/CDA1 family)|nr:polysaccharide deacetylase family protein [Caulobacteraceae bacterium]